MLGEIFKKTKNMVLGAAKGSFKEIITAELNNAGYSFTIINDNLIVMHFSSPDIRYDLFLIFEEESNGYQKLQLRCMTLASFQHNEIKGKKMVNELNSMYRWSCFFIGQEGKLTADIDFELTRSNAARLFLPILIAFMSDLNEAYPIIMKARWSEELQHPNINMDNSIPYQ